MTMSSNHSLESQTNPTCPTGGLGRWLRRLKIAHKLGLGYAIALGVAVAGTTTGIVLGERYQSQSQEVIEDVSEETQALHQLQSSLREIQIQQQQLASLLSQPTLFQEKIITLRESTSVFQQTWAEFESSYDESEIEETSEELEAFDDLLETYPSTAGAYLQQVEALLKQINSAHQTDGQSKAAQALLADFNRRLPSLGLHDFMANLEQLIETIHEELDETQDVLSTASRLRIQIMVVSMTLSVAIAALLALFSGRVTTRPIEALTTVAQRVTQESDFTLRANATTEDEVGVLANSLNQLIEWVGARTQALEQARDTLEQKVKERTQELSAIIENLGDGLLVTDTAGKITWFNHSLLKMFPLATDLMTGKPCQEVFPADIAALVQRNQADPRQLFTDRSGLSGRTRRTSLSQCDSTD